jgi:hypothetical protein
MIDRVGSSLSAVLTLPLWLVAPISTATPATIDDAGKIVVSGERRFVHGIYHDAMDASPMRYQSDFRRDLDVIAGAGFNSVWISIDPTWDEAARDSFAYIDSAQLYVVSNFYMEDAEAVLPHYRGAESLIALSVGDDFNFPAAAPRYQPEQIARNRELVQQHVDGALAFASGGAHPVLALAEYADGMDAMALQCYPISNTDENVPGGVAYELEMCDDMLTSARDELGYDYPMLPTLQAFAWNRDGARPPTAQELRNMLFTSLQFAPAGVFWYSYYDGRQVLSETLPDLWQEISLLTGDVARLEAALLNGRFSKVDNPDDPFLEGTEGAWHAAHWELGSETYLVVTNTDKNSSKLVDIPIPDKQSMAPLFDEPRYPNALRYENGRVRGAAPPRSVHVYRLVE